MHTSNISNEEFKHFLDENYFFSKELQDNEENPMVLENGTYYGAIRNCLFCFESKDENIISVRDIEPEDIKLEHITGSAYENSGIHILFQKWLSDKVPELYARRWIIKFCESVEIHSLSQDEIEGVSTMFEIANIDWDRKPLYGKQATHRIACCKFMITAVKAGVLPWDF